MATPTSVPGPSARVSRSWRHSQVNYDAYNLGPLKWQGDTALEFRRDVLRPFFDQYLNRLLRDPKARIYEFLDPGYVQRVLDEHTSGRVNRRLLIWSLLSFEWWCRSFLESFPARTGGELYALV